MRFWLKNTVGREDAVLTMAMIGFVIIVMKVLVSGIQLSFGDKVIAFGSVDASVIGALLTPTLGAYVARRYTDTKFKSESAVTVNDEVVEEAKDSSGQG